MISKESYGKRRHQQTKALFTESVAGQSYDIQVGSRAG